MKAAAERVLAAARHVRGGLGPSRVSTAAATKARRARARTAAMSFEDRTMRAESTVNRWHARVLT